MNRAVIGGVTGRVYTKVRVRGFAPWDPQKETLVLVGHVKEIIKEYNQPLTIRQIFYRLVGKYGYEKTEQAYGRLCEYMNRARRAGVLPFESFRDDGDNVPSLPGWSGPDEFWDNVRAWARDYFHTPDGKSYVEVWVETAGMAPQIQAVADPFGVRAVPSGGFSSVQARRNAAMRLTRERDHKPAYVLLIGDFDPSGQSIMDSSCSDVEAFGAAAHFEHLAVTEEQAAEHNLIPAPQKATDKRGEEMLETYQAEALDPDVLAEIVRQRLLDLIGEEAIIEADDVTEKERAEILANIPEKRRGRRR